MLRHVKNELACFAIFYRDTHERVRLLKWNPCLILDWRRVLKSISVSSVLSEKSTLRSLAL